MQAIAYFSASFYVARAGIYFNRVLMVSHLAQQPDEELAKLRELWFGDLRAVGRFYVQMIQQAEGIYKQLPNLPALTLPKLPDDYFDWAKAFLQNFRSALTVGSQEELMFSYGFYLGNTLCNLEVLNWALSLHAIGGAKGFAQQKQVAELLNDISSTQFKWGAPALLLGRVEKTQYLWQAWRYLDDLLRQLHEIGAKDNVERYPALAEFVAPLAYQIEEETKKIYAHFS